VSLFSRFRAGGAFLAFFDDDYFYYLRVARNIAAGHGSTFDGSHLTNGYHPLWMLVNVALAWIFPGRTFFLALLAVIFACVMATYAFAERALSRYGSAGMACCAAGLLAADALMLMSGGMEIVLTLPLLAALCAFRLRRFAWNARSGLLYGLLCAALVLSRLDAALFVVLLAVLDLWLAAAVPARARIRTAAAFVAGMLPVLLYLGINLWLFHTAMPVSGEAKELRRHHAMGAAPFRSALIRAWAPEKYFLVWPVLLASLVVLVLVAVRGPGRLERGHRALAAALIVFPYLHLCVLSMLSDWPIWPWYLYPFVGAGLGVALVLFSRAGGWEREMARVGTPVLATGFVLLAAIFAAVQWRNARRPDKLIFSMYFGAVDLRGFAANHPGVYAMGDRAGTPGLLVSEPIVQLEGLVMDKGFLRNFREQKDLKEVLREYGVRYYVATNPTPVGGCYRATEPMAAGPDSYVMHGVFCSRPVDRFFHNGYTTYVFDMRREG
jgi:hypothetical protein